MDRKSRSHKIVKSIDLGSSFSVKQCNNYGIDWRKTLEALLETGIRRFRLMSYWDLHQPSSDTYSFELLDQQISMVEKAGGRVTLCIGIRQPRWPESHIPSWALQLEETERTEWYMAYHEAVILRYKDMPVIESWQLENEFWNRSFGLNNTFSRSRLKREFSMLRSLDPTRPIIMSLANTYGYPLLGPKADIYGTTMYLRQYESGRYTSTKLTPLYFRIRRVLVKVITRKELIIHELQAEPWGPNANWEMTDHEQSLSMSPEQLKACIQFARDSKILYADLWGAEWWYWRKTSQKDLALWSTLTSQVSNSKSLASL